MTTTEEIVKSAWDNEFPKRTLYMKVSEWYSKYGHGVKTLAFFWFGLATFDIILYEILDSEYFYNNSLKLFKWWFIIFAPPVIIGAGMHFRHGKRVDRVKQTIFELTGRKYTTAEINSIVNPK